MGFWKNIFGTDEEEVEEPETEEEDEEVEETAEEETDEEEEEIDEDQKELIDGWHKSISLLNEQQRIEFITLVTCMGYDNVSDEDMNYMIKKIKEAKQ